MAQKQVRKTDFEKLFTQAGWCPQLKELIKDRNQLAQFVSFMRSEAFIEAMLKTSQTPEGRKNIVEALQDKELRRTMLRNFDSYTVRWAMGDLFNSPAGNLIMEDILFRIPPDIRPVFEILGTMITTEVPDKEAMGDFNRYKFKENEDLHARREDLKWLEDKFSSDPNVNMFLLEMGEATGQWKLFPPLILETKEARDAFRGRVSNLLRTQEVRQTLNKIMRTEKGRERIAKALKNEAAFSVLKEAMRTPEGINLLGFLFNMSNGKKMLREQLLNLSGLIVLKDIMGAQQEYISLVNRRKGVLRAKPKPRR